MTDALVHYEKRGDIAWLTMDDGKANALSPALIEALDAALARAVDDAKAIVLAGRPGRFCAGYDLKVMMSGKGPASALTAQGAEMMGRLYTLPLPVVIACTGHAMAGGALVLLCGDRRIGVAGGFKIGLNEVQIGIPLPQFGIDLVTDRLDPREVTNATMASTIYDPDGAAEAGFLDRVVAAEELEAAVQAEAEGLAKLSTNAYAKTKFGVRKATADKFVAEVHANLDALLS